MKPDFIEKLRQSAVIREGMSSKTVLASESVNAVALAQRMDIGIDILSQAIGAEASALNAQPRILNFKKHLEACHVFGTTS